MSSISSKTPLRKYYPHFTSWGSEMLAHLFGGALCRPCNVWLNCYISLTREESLKVAHVFLHQEVELSVHQGEAGLAVEVVGIRSWHFTSVRKYWPDVLGENHEAAMTLKVNPSDEMLERLFSDKYSVIFSRTILHWRQRTPPPSHQVGRLREDNLDTTSSRNKGNESPKNHGVFQSQSDSAGWGWC